MFKKKLALFAVCLLTILSASCVEFSHALFDSNNINEPPRHSPDVVVWWDQTVDIAPLEFLAIYLEAAEAHRKEGTSATYDTVGTSIKMGASFQSTYSSSYHLPCPPPEYAYDRLKLRLKGHDRFGALDPRWQIADVEACHGCTKAAAITIWKEAEDRVRNRPAPDNRK
jgi:hypothetical protein